MRKDIQSWEPAQQTIALLKILALGRQQVERSEFSSAEAVFAELDEDMRGIEEKAE